MVLCSTSKEILQTEAEAEEFASEQACTDSCQEEVPEFKESLQDCLQDERNSLWTIRRTFLTSFTCVAGAQNRHVAVLKIIETDASAL